MREDSVQETTNEEVAEEVIAPVEEKTETVESATESTSSNETNESNESNSNESHSMNVNEQGPQTEEQKR
ncbi:MAG: hypothetical protein IPJ60_12295 [Sphingobacteriaceae bacterium]|nr:hypothetical protein [Sphingobacteriaceae bacterium]